MERWHVFQDGQMIGSAATKDAALELIRANQENEIKAHQWLHASFSMIYGEEIFVPYEQKRRTRK